MPAGQTADEGGLGQASSQPCELVPLSDSEKWWTDRQLWLHERGYTLRARYRPGWTPSWMGSKKRWTSCEDSLTPIWSQVLDATRMSDGAMVLIKKVKTSVHPFEVDITSHFSLDPLVSDSRNHCVPLYEVLDDPDDQNIKLMVMPFLREFGDPRFETIGEAVEFFRQVFEGLQFMHHNGVAHRDCMDLNIMMDLKPLYPNLFHPVAQDFNRDYKGQASHHTRTKRPVKYFFIDFGISRKYDVGQEAPLEPPIFGGDKSVPEFQMSIDPVNPFPTDIYYLGNMIREEFLNSTSGLEFMQPLVADMVRKDPTQRPTINEVAARFDELRANLSSQVLRSRLVYLDENELAHAYYNVRHFFRTIYYVLARYPAVPTPSP